MHRFTIPPCRVAMASAVEGPGPRGPGLSVCYTGSTMSTPWLIAGMLAVVILAIYSTRRSVVWSMFLASIAIGIFGALFLFMKGGAFNFMLIAQAAIVGVGVGFLVEVIGFVSDLVRTMYNRSWQTRLVVYASVLILGGLGAYLIWAYAPPEAVELSRELFR